jgi:hypothetical protein
MHYFRAAYVGEWLCGNDMCPLFRADAITNWFSSQGHLHGVTTALC